MDEIKKLEELERTLKYISKIVKDMSDKEKVEFIGELESQLSTERQTIEYNIRYFEHIKNK